MFDGILQFYFNNGHAQQLQVTCAVFYRVVCVILYWCILLGSSIQKSISCVPVTKERPRINRRQKQIGVGFADADVALFAVILAQCTLI